jgi:hypothetical protein
MGQASSYLPKVQQTKSQCDVVQLCCILAVQLLWQDLDLLNSLLVSLIAIYTLAERWLPITSCCCVHRRGISQEVEGLPDYLQRLPQPARFDQMQKEALGECRPYVCSCLATISYIWHHLGSHGKSRTSGLGPFTDVVSCSHHILIHSLQHGYYLINSSGLRRRTQRRSSPITSRGSRWTSRITR